jgi:hypothetical protein
MIEEMFFVQHPKNGMWQVARKGEGLYGGGRTLTYKEKKELVEKCVEELNERGREVKEWKKWYSTKKKEMRPEWEKDIRGGGKEGKIGGKREGYEGENRRQWGSKGVVRVGNWRSERKGIERRSGEGRRESGKIVWEDCRSWKEEEERRERERRRKNGGEGEREKEKKRRREKEREEGRRDRERGEREREEGGEEEREKENRKRKREEKGKEEERKRRKRREGEERR